MSALAALLLQLVCGGMMVVSTYETIMHGRNGSEKRMKRHACDGCQSNLEDIMRSDLNYFLDKGGKNEDLVDEIKDYMQIEYDWLEFYVLVYNDLYGFDKHIYNGRRVSSLHRNGKCAIVFYRRKDEKPRFSHRHRTAILIVRSVGNDGVQQAYENIVAKMEARNIGWTGLAVITRYPDLWAAGYFSTKTFFIVGRYHTAILLLQ